MRKSLSLLLLLLLFLLSTIATSVAGSRYHSSAYRSNFHPRPYAQYRHFSRSHRNHYYNSNDFWAPLGFGLLTGIVVGAVINQPPRQQNIAYNTYPPVFVRADPLIVQEQYIDSPLPPPELVLRRVETTAKLLNVRVGPGLETNVTSQVQQGTILDVIGTAPDWLYIRTASGQYGWVMSKYTLEAEGPVG